MSEKNAWKTIRINRLLSDAGVCSRREADQLIASGRVSVDGRRAVMGEQVSEDQRVCLDGRPVRTGQEKVLLALYKPRGIVCTTDRVREKNNIVDFVHYPVRIYPVGRLDYQTTGLLLLTNDGDLDYLLTHPKNHIPRVYEAVLRGHPTADALQELESGVKLACSVPRT